MERKTCKTCAYFNPNQNICVLARVATSEDSSCPQHNINPVVCAACQSYIIGTSFFEKTANGWIEICAKCAKAISTCAGCKSGAYCAFAEDPSPLPKIVAKTLRQGNTIMQTQVPNPERIRLLCEKCDCFDFEDKTCNRECKTCRNYHSILNP